MSDDSGIAIVVVAPAHESGKRCTFTRRFARYLSNSRPDPVHLVRPRSRKERKRCEDPATGAPTLHEIITLSDIDGETARCAIELCRAFFEDGTRVIVIDMTEQGRVGILNDATVEFAEHRLLLRFTEGRSLPHRVGDFANIYCFVPSSLTRFTAPIGHLMRCGRLPRGHIGRYVSTWITTGRGARSAAEIIDPIIQQFKKAA